MLLLDAINWLVTAILWFFAPVFRLFGLYAVAAGAVVVVVFAGFGLLRRGSKRPPTGPS